jgi:hypothetical protein
MKIFLMAIVGVMCLVLFGLFSVMSVVYTSKYIVFESHVNLIGAILGFAGAAAFLVFFIEVVKSTDKC